jgi:hypothetical protein
VDVAHGLADSLDQIDAVDYYRFLDCGFQLPLSNGSDHPARLVGICRVYVQTDQPFTYDRWIQGLVANRTFTTSGPLLFLDVNGREVGDVLQVPEGDPLTLSVEAISRRALGNLEIVVNGEVITRTNTPAPSAELQITLPAREPCWVVARCSPSDNYNALSGPGIAHTSAVYVNVDGRSRFEAGAANEWVRRMRLHADDLRRQGRFPSGEAREDAVAYIEDGVRVFESLVAFSNADAPAEPDANFVAYTNSVHASAKALEEAGSPFTATSRNALENLDRYTGAHLTNVVQRILHPHTLFQIHINPEMRVKVSRGPAKALLVRGEWVLFLAEIRNECGTTAPLFVESPNAWTGEDEDRQTWLELEVRSAARLPVTLSGRRLEYRLVALRAHEEGKRAARINLNVGQGTQDIGFRNEVDILFECRDALEDPGINQPMMNQ